MLEFQRIREGVSGFYVSEPVLEQFEVQGHLPKHLRIRGRT
jgi:hypothetical protein